MRAVLKLEFFAENYFAYKRQVHVPNANVERYKEMLGRDQSRPWVARIDGPDEQYGLKRTFMRAQIDYSQANGTGSRGVYLYFALRDGIYEVNERLSWHRVRRYFVSVVDAHISEISREEVASWVQSKV